MGYLYWDYYLSLENDLLKTKRFVDFSQESNLKVNSIEFARIILSSCAEIDMVCKELCKKLNKPKCNNIKNYRETILAYNSNFNIFNRKVICANIQVSPFKE